MQRLAAMIEAYWHGRGFKSVKVEAIDETTIRSNLRNGVPPNHYFRGYPECRIVERWS